MRVKAILIIVLVLAVGVFVGVSIVNMHKQVCEEVQITVKNTGKDVLLTRQDISNLLKEANITLVGTPKNEVKKSIVDKALKKNNWYGGLEEFSFNGNVLTIQVAVKKPFMQVFPSVGDTYFVDNQGGFLPYSDKVTTELVVLTGNIQTAYAPAGNVKDVKEKSLFEAFQVAQLIQQDEFLNAQISQLFINQEGEIELYGRVGRQVVLFGHADGAAEKLANLKTAYQDALVFLDADHYKKLDLRFTNRIVATKR